MIRAASNSSRRVDPEQPVPPRAPPLAALCSSRPWCSVASGLLDSTRPAVRTAPHRRIRHAAPRVALPLATWRHQKPVDSAPNPPRGSMRRSGREYLSSRCQTLGSCPDRSGPVLQHNVSFARLDGAELARRSRTIGSPGPRHPARARTVLPPAGSRRTARGYLFPNYHSPGHDAGGDPGEDVHACGNESPRDLAAARAGI